MVKVLSSIRDGLKLINYGYNDTRYWNCSGIGCKVRTKTGNIQIDLFTAKFSYSNFCTAKLPTVKFPMAKLPVTLQTIDYFLKTFHKILYTVPGKVGIIDMPFYV